MRKNILLLVLSVLIAGCASVPAKGIAPKKASQLYEETETFVYLSKGLNKQLLLVDQALSSTEDARLVVKAKLFNKLAEDLRVQFQTIFKDKDGYPTGDETNWELVVIPHNAYCYYEAKAMNIKAEKYVTRCRYAE
ncbi:MAG: hypothetical protein M0R17_15070 [Candidatus Omnitrophica bacterium]|jgi:uncharacterized protein YcfL|nr:hypothetical protein [Candidatus Omnitrophota bacterium]MDD5252355.1 hypothetical protein [Candidatus Omnitrophota bacterium]